MLKTRTPTAHEVPQRVVDRIWARYDVRGPEDCWPWLLSVGGHGYGQVGWSVDGRKNSTTAHRVAWMAANGPIPDGMTVDHTGQCANKLCGNPAHLRLLTNVDNATDNHQGAKTHCPARHPYAGTNLYVDPRGHRLCRACRACRRAKGAS